MNNEISSAQIFIIITLHKSVLSMTEYEVYWSLVFHNRWLLAEMSRIAADVILEICRQADVEPGIFTVIHTWGRDQQWHPHIHLSIPCT